MGRAVAAAAAGVVGLVLIGAVAAASPAKKLPPYVTENGGAFRVNANAHWRTVRQFIPDSRYPDTIAAVWAKTCPRGEQTATFTRTITIPGPPADANFQVNPLWGSAVAAPGANSNPIDWAELKVNGRLLLHRRLTATYFTAELDDKTVRHAFRFGANDVEVRVHRRALPAAVKGCNVGGKDFLHDPTHLGVQFALWGDFAADLGFEPKPKAVYKKVSGGVETITAQGSITFANAGPSGVANGKLTLNAGAELLAVRNAGDCKAAPGVKESTGPLGDTFVNLQGVVSIVCDVHDFAPGTRRTVTISTAKKTNVTTDFTELRMTLSWAIYGAGPGDPDTTNNQGTEELVFCGKLSTLEGCKTAK